MLNLERLLSHPSQLRAAASLLLLTSFVVSAEAADPRLASIVPRGAQRGTEIDVTLRGDRLDDAKEIVFYEPGIEVIDLAAKSDKELHCKFRIGSECALGTVRVRVRTASGVSDLQSFRIGPFPDIQEKEPNSDFGEPQAIPLNVTVNGTISNEDVDYFVVEAQKGQRITAEVEAIRLGDSMFDAYVAIFNQARFELSTSDDAALVYQDGIASIIVPEDGKYIVQVRESSFANGNHYRLHVGTFPRPRAIVPAGGPAGSQLKVAFHGDVTGAFEQTVQIPENAPWGFGVIAQDSSGIAPASIPFRVSALENIIEQEPNNDVASATPATAPGAFNGLIGEPGDIDYYRFTARKGQVLDIRVFARQLRSELDTVLSVHNDKGAAIASNDDSGGPDSYLRFNPPADGEFLVALRDHLNRGGSSYHYRIELTPVEPKLELSVNEFARYKEHKLAVPTGNRFAMLVAATRKDFRGDLEFIGENLPEGVSIEAAPCGTDEAVAQIILVAKDGAPMSAALSQIIGKMIVTEENKSLLPVTGITRQDATMVRGQNQRPFFIEELPTLALVVTDKVPFHVDIVEPKVPLVQNGVMSLKVVARRDEGFTAPIKVDLLQNPNGVNSSREVSIAEGQTEAVIAMNAAGNALVRDQKLALRATATVGNGTVEAASPFVNLKVSEPYVKLNYQQAAIEIGGESAMVVGVEVLKPFEGEAEVKLTGLPNQVTAPDLKINKDTKELVFPLKADEKASPGITKNVFSVVTIVENGEPIVHNLGNGTLRVDKPLPPKVQPVAKPDKPAEPKPVAEAPKKPLSRLEQLRLEQKQRLEGMQ